MKLSVYSSNKGDNILLIQLLCSMADPSHALEMNLLCRIWSPTRVRQLNATCHESRSHYTHVSYSTSKVALCFLNND